MRSQERRCRWSIDSMASLRSSYTDYRDRESASREVNRSAVDAPLTRDRILATAEEVIRRFGPDKATLVDVARALGVSHAAVYRHVTSKAELRDLVVGRLIEATMPALRAIV